MIFDPTLSLQYFETLPVYLGMVQKIARLKEKQAYFEKQLEHNPSKVNAERLAEVESDLRLFEELVMYIKNTLQSMAGLFEQFKAQVKASNRTADFMEKLLDMQELYYLEQAENKILNEIISKLLADRGKDPAKMDAYLNGIREHSKTYFKLLQSKCQIKQ
jgi:hypothetical protein